MWGQHRQDRRSSSVHCEMAINTIIHLVPLAVSDDHFQESVRGGRSGSITETSKRREVRTPTKEGSSKPRNLHAVLKYRCVFLLQSACNIIHLIS